MRPSLIFLPVFKKIYVNIFLFLITLIILLKTVSPTVSPGDSGELITASALLGIPHNPGYPFFCLIGHIMTFLPLGNIAYRVNLLSALCLAASVPLFFQIISLFSKSLILKTALSLALPFTLTIWSQGLISEVYMLYFITLLNLIFLTFKINHKTSLKYWFFWSFLAGLALSAHFSFLLLLPAFLTLVLIKLNIQRRFNRENGRSFPLLKISLLSILLFNFALTVFLYLPIRSFKEPAIDWGDPQNIKGFWHMVSAEEHRHKSLLKSFNEQLSTRAVDVYEHIREQVSFFGIISAVYGIFLLPLPISLFLILLIIGDLIYTIFLNVIPMDVTGFCYATVIALLILTSRAMISICSNRKKTVSRALASASLLIPIILISYNYYFADKSHNFFSLDYGKNLLLNLPFASTLNVSGDNQTFSILFCRCVLKMRPDIYIYSRAGVKIDFGNQFIGNEGDILKHFYTTPPDTKNPAGYTLYDDGIVQHYIPSAEEKTTTSPLVFKYLEGRYADDKRVHLDLMSAELASKYLYTMGLVFKRKNDIENALKSFKMAGERGKKVHFLQAKLGLVYEDMNQLDLAITSYKQALVIEPKFEFAYQRLGVITFRQDKFDDAFNYFNKLLLINPNNAVAHYYLGSLAEYSGNSDKAEQHFRKAVQFDPDYAQAHNNLGVILYHKEELVEAEKEFLTAIIKDPSFAQAYKNLGSLYFYKLKKYDLAIKAWQEYLKLSPQANDAPLVRNEIATMEKLLQSEQKGKN